MALDLLTVYYKNKEDLARQCVTAKHDLWGKKDTMLLAVNSMCRAFVAHPLVQKILKDLWRGKVS